MSPYDGPLESDYERIGGGPAVSSVVTRFYDLVLADPQVAPFFTGVDIYVAGQIARVNIASPVGAGREPRTASPHGVKIRALARAF